MTDLSNYYGVLLLIIIATFRVVIMAEEPIDDDKDICHLVIDEGDCGSDSVSSSDDPTNATVMYGYNINTTKCEEFLYEGCVGNKNRFETDDECRKTCYTPLHYFVAKVTEVFRKKYNIT